MFTYRAIGDCSPQVEKRRKKKKRKEEEQVENEREKRRSKKRREGEALSLFFFFSTTSEEKKNLSVPFHAPQTPSPRFIDGSFSCSCFGSTARLLSASLRGELCRGEREVFFFDVAFFFFCLSIATSFPAIVDAPLFPFPRVSRPTQGINCLFS